MFKCLSVLEYQFSGIYNRTRKIVKLNSIFAQIEYYGSYPVFTNLFLLRGFLSLVSFVADS